MNATQDLELLKYTFWIVFSILGILVSIIGILIAWKSKTSKDIEVHKREFKDENRETRRAIEEATKEHREMITRVEKFVTQVWGELKELAPRVAYLEKSFEEYKKHNEQRINLLHREITKSQ